MEHADLAIMTNRPIAPDALYCYADKNDIFISFNGMACAGSTKKINEFIELCSNGGAHALGDHLELANIVSQPANWYQYALATIELDCFIEKERAIRAAKHRLNPESDLQHSEKIYSDVGNYALGLIHGAHRMNHVNFEDGALMRQNAILGLLGRPAIKDIPREHFQARLG